MARKSSRDALRERAARVAAGTSDPAPDPNPPAGTPDPAPVRSRPARPRSPRTHPVKVTVELQPLEHRRLRQWCAETAADLDLPLVAAAEVFRVLWDLMLKDRDLAARVREELERTGGSRRR